MTATLPEASAPTEKVFSRLLGKSLSSMTVLGGGRNSRVYKLQSGDGEIFVGKEYFVHPTDPRNRLKTEYAALVFLWKNNFRDIAKPIAVDYSKNVALYSFIDGFEINSGNITDDDIDCAVHFLSRLRESGSVPGSKLLRNASAACFSVSAIHSIISGRLKRLFESSPGDCTSEELDVFLNDEFFVTYNEISKWTTGLLTENGRGLETILADHFKTLSPSDFGYHNALRSRSGTVIFLDFEYFGWDDPAKMIADFLFHDGMDLPPQHKQRFVDGIFKVFADDELLGARVEIAYPLIGLVWCLLILNEFVIDDLRRREFVIAEIDVEGVRQRQLKKSKKLLREIRQNYGHFPYK